MNGVPLREYFVRQHLKGTKLREIYSEEEKVARQGWGTDWTFVAENEAEEKRKKRSGPALLSQHSVFINSSFYS